jgi:hypothetical protein|tara:strand:- start:2800 stop:2925 length:126 start_codon:yes stop_codon:yes gene_type:complete
MKNYRIDKRNREFLSACAKASANKIINSSLLNVTPAGELGR